MKKYHIREGGIAGAMGKKTENIVSFAERTMETFEEKPFSSVDSLILSWMSYLHWAEALPEVRSWSGVRFAELFRAESFDAMLFDVWEAEKTRKLFAAMTASPRYRNMQVKGFVEKTEPEAEKQFAAVCFQLQPERTYVAFRGTDTSLVGWKEDFNMAFQYPVPAQEDAAAYLETAGRKCGGTLLTGGHSKGGNLAICASFSGSRDLKRRIETIYSHDGPGFLPKVLESKDFLSVQSRIRKSLPQGSVVGMLLEQQERFQVVKSDRLSLWQHDPFSWMIRGGRFCYLKELAPDAQYANHTISEWLNGLSRAERERFVDALYEILNVKNAESFTDLLENWQETVPAMLHAAAELDEDTKKFVLQTLKELALLSLKNFPSMFRRKKNSKA